MAAADLSTQERARWSSTKLTTRRRKNRIGQPLTDSQIPTGGFNGPSTPLVEASTVCGMATQVGNNARVRLKIFRRGRRQGR